MKQLKDFPDYYITEDAKIISKRCKKEKELKQNLGPYGYLRVGMQTPDGRMEVHRIHRLMMLTYGGEPPKGMKDPTVDHINGDKVDNRIENLQWLSNADNAYKAAKHRIKTYTIQSRSGEVFVVENLNKWCGENNLDRCCLLRSYNKGWWHKEYKIISK
jgi:hypothetical protein